MEADLILEMKELSFSYGETKALESVNLRVRAKEFIAVIGPNGGGKTTMIKLMLGLLPAERSSLYKASELRIGYVPQHESFNSSFPITVREVILLGHLPSRLSFGRAFQKEEKEHALSIMRRLNIEDLAKRQIGMLSGGQMKRVLIARALMFHPDLLVLDEAVAGVDEHSKHEIFMLLKQLSKELTIIMITHSPEEVADMADRFIYVNKQINEPDKSKVLQYAKALGVTGVFENDQHNKQKIMGEQLR